MISKKTIVGSAFYLGYWGAIGSFMPFINVYFVQIGLTGREIGVLAALGPLATLLVAPSVAALADRRRWRVPILASALLGLGVTVAMLTIAHSFVTLLSVILALALCRCPVAAVGDSLIANMAVRHGLPYGHMRLWGSLSFAVIAAGCGLAWQRFGYGAMFLVGGMLFIPVAIVAAQLEEGPAVPPQERKPLRAVLAVPALRTLLVATTVVGGAIGIDLIFDGIYVHQLGSGNAMVGLLVGVAAISELPMMAFGHRLLRRLGGPGTLLVAYALLAFGFVGFALAGNPWVALSWSIIRGLGFGLFFISTVWAINDQAPCGWEATLQAAMNAGAFGLAQLVSGPLGGWILDSAGVSAVYLVCAGLVALASTILVRGIQKRTFSHHPTITQHDA